MHVVGKALAGNEHLAHGQRTFHDERLVDPHEVFHPRQLQKVVADGYLAGGGEVVLYEQHVEQCRVEHNVSVVAHKGVALVVVNRADVHVKSCCCGAHELFQEWIHERFLKLKVCGA